MSYNIGLNLIETDGKATPSIQAAPTSVAGFLILAERGVPGKVCQVVNWSQFREHFGSFRTGAHGAYAVQGFFDNGGTMAYVTRLTATGAASAVAASATVGTDLTVRAGYLGQEDPGAWGRRLALVVTRNNDTGKVEIGVSLWPGNESPQWTDSLLKQHRVEVWEAASPAEWVKAVNNESAGSKFVTVAPGTAPAFPQIENDANGNPIPQSFPLQGGSDDSLSQDNVAGEVNNALHRFDTCDIQLLCCPESSEAAVVSALLAYCENRGDCLFVGHTPSNAVDPVSAKEYGRPFRGNKIYGALYYPWIRVYDPADPAGHTAKYIPPTGHILGVYARTDLERGIWKAPAGNAARLKGALDVKKSITDVEHTDLVKNGSVNAVRYLPGQGIIIDSSRTLSTNTLWLYVNVRLLFNFVKSSLKSGLRWVVQEPNSESLWNKIKFNSVTPFLMGLWRHGAFGPGAPEQVFSVKVDAENNPPANIQQGILNVEVYFYPSRPAETIVITVGQQEGGASAGEK